MAFSWTGIQNADLGTCGVVTAGMLGE